MVNFGLADTLTAKSLSRSIFKIKKNCACLSKQKNFWSALQLAAVY